MILEAIYLTSFSLYCTSTILQSTMLSYVDGIEQVLVYSRYAALMLCVLLFAVQLVCDGRELVQRPFRPSRLYPMLFRLAFLSVFVVSALRSKNNNLIYLALYLVTFRRTDIRHVLRLFLAVHFLVFLAMLFCCFSGSVDNLHFIRLGSDRLRYSLGYVYPSIPTSVFFYWILAFLWLRQGHIRVWELVLLLSANLLLFYFTDSRFGALLVFLALVTCIPLRVRRGSSPASPRLPKTGPVGWPDCLPFFFSIFSLAGSLFCQYIPFRFLDTLITNRFTYAHAALNAYPHTLFGQAIEWIGFGGTANSYAVDRFYNFVDCSYVHDLVNFGYIPSLLLLLGSVLVFHEVRRRTRGGLYVWLLFLSLCYSVIEPHGFELYYNVFLLLIADIVPKGLMGIWRSKGRPATFPLTRGSLILFPALLAVNTVLFFYPAAQPVKEQDAVISDMTDIPSPAFTYVTRITKSQNAIVWETLPSVSGYELSRCVAGSEPDGFVPIADITGQAGQYLDTGLVPGDSYLYRIRAFAEHSDGTREFGDYSPSLAESRY